MNLKVSSATEKDILNLSIEKFSWKTNGQFDRLGELFDDDLVFIHLTGIVTTKDEWMAELQARRFVYHKIGLKEASVKLYGDVAVLVGKAKFDVAYHGSKGTFKLIYTEVYARKNDKWKLVNLHTTSAY